MANRESMLKAEQEMLDSQVERFSGIIEKANKVVKEAQDGVKFITDENQIGMLRQSETGNPNLAKALALGEVLHGLQENIYNAMDELVSFLSGECESIGKSLRVGIVEVGPNGELPEDMPEELKEIIKEHLKDK